MRVVIAGGSGFLGQALTRQLTADGHEVVILTRKAGATGAAGAIGAAGAATVTYRQWRPDGSSGEWAQSLDGAAAVINLAGESIAARRWSPAQKQKLEESRLRATGSLAAAIREVSRRPVFLSGSAVGYYGDRGDETIAETSAPGNDFLAALAQRWEAAASSAADVTRVVLVRTGIVLDRREGALARMLPPFRMFAGGPLGGGEQYMPWIHRDDWVRMVIWAIGEERARGPLNATAPHPVTNREFSKALGRALKRPALLPAPAFALRLALGEMADALLLSGQRALPVKATDLGFAFRFPHIDDALVACLR